MNGGWPVVLVLPAFITAIVTVALARSGLAQVLVDRPNERSLHAAPTPRLGGLALIVGALPVAALHGGAALGVTFACALGLAMLSALDDWRSLPVSVRLPGHAFAALVAVAALDAPGVALASLAGVGLALAFVWMTNLYNFMDGADGLAGLMGLVGFGALAIAAAEAGQFPLASACAAIASASAAFLAFNFPPARIFMGDAGSIPLGFLAAALGAHGAISGAWPSWFPVLVFSPFIVDASVTIARRLARGERIWIAHRSHYYQRLVLAGWTTRRLLGAEALLMLGAAGCALHAAREGEMLQCGILAGWSALYVVLVTAIERKTRNNNMNGTDARKSNGAPGEEK